MKTILLVSLACVTALGTFAQGTINIGNYFSADNFCAPIYGFEPGSLAPITGQSPLGLPAGTTVYSGPLLQGSGYAFAVYYGPAAATDQYSLTLLFTTTFRTTTAVNALPAGLVTATTVPVPNTSGGDIVSLQVRVWDYNGGFSPSWDMAIYRAASPIFQSGPLGGISTSGNLFPTPPMTGWTSFNLYSIPEPKAFVLGGTAAALWLVFRLCRPSNTRKG
jgi:hypothetical protein